MRRPAAFFPIALVLGAMMLVPRAVAQAQDSRAEGPREIEKCKTISKPGSYRLVNNLSATGGCVAITADFVTIDLAGFSISGGITGTGILAAPSSGQLQGIAVRNGSISGFSIGVDLSSADGSIVEGLRVFGGSGVPAGGIIAKGIVKGNTATGIPEGSGISATGTVTGNYTTENFVGISASAGSTVIGNTANFNNRVGITAGCPVNLTDNTAIGNFLGDLFLVGEGCHNEDNVAPNTVNVPP
jgi:hypothetical protein